jgi:hypothetical protein
VSVRTSDTISSRYEQLLLTIQTLHTQLLAGIESFHQARYEAVVEMLQEMIELFDLIAVEDLVTLTETQRRHVALVLHEARRCLTEARQEGT